MKVARGSRGQFWGITLGLAALLFVRALELRIPMLARPFWQDEVRHNEVVLNSANMAELDRINVYKGMFQPKLDFWMRHDLWFPLLGVNERAMRIPALVFGVALVLLVYAVLVGFFASRVQQRWAPVLAFVASLWIVDQEVQVYYSGEARHYSLVALASTLWFTALLLYRGKPRWLLALSSLLFVNTHFFALPLVAAGYGLQILREVRLRHYGWIAFHLLTCFLIYECTVRLNWAPLAALLHKPPGTKHAPLNAIFTLPQLQAGLAVWWYYVETLLISPAAWIIWLVVFVAAVVRRQARWVPLLLVVLLVLPAFCVYLRFRSTYTIGVRYYAPFFGTGLLTIIAGLDVVLREWRRLASVLAVRARKPILAVSVLGFACLFSAPAFAYHLVADWRDIHSVPKNASPYYVMYSSLAREPKPVLIIQSRCGDLDMTDLYFHSIVALPQGSHVEWIQLGCAGANTARQTLHHFLSTHAAEGGIIVLDQKQLDCTGHPLPAFELPARVEELRGISCVWKVTGVTTPNQLAKVATALGFTQARHIR